MLEESMRLMLRKSFVGIKICTTILIDLDLGRFQKYKNFQNIKIIFKQLMMEYARQGHPFLFAVLNKKTKSDFCIGMTNNMIVESQLLGNIDLNERNLDLILGDDDDVGLI